MLIDRRNLWKLHGPWLIATAAGTAAVLGWYIARFATSGRWPGGGSVPGLVMGGLAAVIFLFEVALIARRKKPLRTARWALSAQTWMKAHIWLGLFTVPLVILHSGGRLGGTLTSMLVLVFAVVILSGIWGLALQNVLPRMLLENAAAETIYSQIDAVGRQYVDEAERLVLLQCGGEATDLVATAASPRQPVAAFPGPDSADRLARGAARNVGAQVKLSPHPARDLPEAIPSPAIRAALRETIAPYLATGESDLGLLGSRSRNRWFFDDLRLRVAPELRGLVAQLEELCERRRQLNVQRQLHGWLHNWLWLHVPLSLALIVLLVGHVILALRYG